MFIITAIAELTHIKVIAIVSLLARSVLFTIIKSEKLCHKVMNFKDKSYDVIRAFQKEGLEQFTEPFDE